MVTLSRINVAIKIQVSHRKSERSRKQSLSLSLFLSFSFLPFFLFPFKGLCPELSLVPSEQRGGPGRNVCLNGLSLLVYHSVTFLCVAQL